MKKKYNTLRLILGDQLNRNHSWYQSKDESVLYVLMEVRSETDYVWHHIQKACAFFAAMENFAEHLKAKGHQVKYIKLDDEDNLQSFEKNCDALIQRYGIEQFHYQLPDEYRLDVALAKYAETLSVETKLFDTEHFFTKRLDVKISLKARSSS